LTRSIAPGVKTPYPVLVLQLLQNRLKLIYPRIKMCLGTCGFRAEGNKIAYVSDRSEHRVICMAKKITSEQQQHVHAPQIALRISKIRSQNATSYRTETKGLFVWAAAFEKQL
jgi:hypothetical protein